MGGQEIVIIHNNDIEKRIKKITGNPKGCIHEDFVPPAKKNVICSIAEKMSIYLKIYERNLLNIKILIHCPENKSQNS